MDDACHADTAALEPWLVEIVGHVVQDPPKLALAPLGVTGPRLVGLRVTVLPGDLRIQGEPADLGEVLRSYDLERSWDHGMSRGVTLLVDGATPWGEVAATLRTALDAGYPDPVLVYARPIRVAPPADTPLPTSERQLFELHRIGTGPCASLGEAELRDLPPKEWAAGVVKELRACGCGGDLDAWRAYLWGRYGPALYAPVTTVVLHLAEGASPFEAAAAEPWSEVGPRLAASGRPVSVSVREAGPEPR